jgi:hypothetical protein
VTVTITIPVLVAPAVDEMARSESAGDIEECEAHPLANLDMCVMVAQSETTYLAIGHDKPQLWSVDVECEPQI